MTNVLHKSLLAVACFLCSIGAIAEDFTVDGFHYNITDETNKTVAVTYYGDNEWYVPDEYKYIGDVTVPESVTYEGTTYSVTAIGDFAFMNCDNLTSVTIPGSATSIGKNAFSASLALTSVTIGSGVTEIGDMAFSYCTGLAEIIVDENNTTYDSRDNCNAIIEKATNTLIVGCKNSTIPESVTSIGERAFEGSTDLTSITIPNSVTSIGESAFYYCKNLASVTIPESVTSIGECAFYDCNSLTKVTIGSGVAEIGDIAFANCLELAEIVVDGNNTTYDSRDNCNAIIEKATNTLIVGCKNSTIPESVTSIGENAFYCCEGLTDITFPESVTLIGESAFESCTDLTSITIGSCVTEIARKAFYLCKGLTEITCYATTPPVVQEYAFSDEIYSQATLHVVKGCKGAYSSASYWGNFLNITDDLTGLNGVEADNNSITVINGRLHVEGVDAGVAVNIYNTSGALVQQTTVGEVGNVALPRGLYLVQVGNMAKRVVM